MTTDEIQPCSADAPADAPPPSDHRHRLPVPPGVELVPESRAWPPRDVVTRLADFANYMLVERDYDGHGWEELQRCRDEAHEWLCSDEDWTITFDQRRAARMTHMTADYVAIAYGDARRVRLRSTSVRTEPK